MEFLVVIAAHIELGLPVTVIGKYYNFDSSESDHHDSCMADQLAGHWFLKASKIPDDAVSGHDTSCPGLCVMKHVCTESGGWNVCNDFQLHPGSGD